MNKVVIVDFIKRHERIMNLLAFLYSVFYGSNIWRYAFRKNVCFKGAFLKHTKLHVGNNSSVVIGKKCQMNHCVISVATGGGIFIDGSQSCINNTRFVVREGGQIRIGEDFSMLGGIIQSVDGKAVEIGSHCMFSGDIDILSGDLHPIFLVDSHSIINAAQQVTISDNVWLGAHVKVLKGSFIAPYAVVGCSSLVSGILKDPNSVYCGVPARKIKSGVDWARSEDGVNLLRKQKDEFTQQHT